MLGLRRSRDWSEQTGFSFSFLFKQIGATKELNSTFLSSLMRAMSGVAMNFYKENSTSV